MKKLLYLLLLLFLVGCVEPETHCIKGFPNGLVVRKSYNDNQTDMFWVQAEDGLYVIYTPDEYEIDYILNTGDSIKCPCYEEDHSFKVTKDITKKEVDDVIDTVHTSPVMKKKE